MGTYLVIVLVFCFYKYDVMDQWSWENIAYRAGCIAQTQLPLIFLLAGKQNIIGALTGVSYEKLNYLHRWVARILWITVTIHMSFWFRSWARYDYILFQLRNDDMTQTGFAAWVILTFIVLITLAPVRQWNYELFVITHLVTFAGLIGAIMTHVDDGKVYIWIPIGIYFLDRLLRAGKTIFLNLNIFRRGKGIWANKATLTPLPGGVTRISISNVSNNWNPGQHMFLSCHSIVPLQSHPFTIASLPSDARMDFIVKSHRGGTKRYLDYASKVERLPETKRETKVKRVAVEGPYGQIRPLEQFDSVVLFAGSTGATFTMPLMRDIVRRWHSSLPAVTRHVRFVWAIKSRDHTSWFGDQLSQVLRDTAIPGGDRTVEMSVYVTCDENLEANTNSSLYLPTSAQISEVSSESSSKADEKKQQGDIVEVRSVGSGSESESQSESESGAGGCGPDGSCCCKATVTDEKEAPECCCSKLSKARTSSTVTLNKTPRPTWHSDPRLKLLSGRPHPRSIIRRLLEDAEGESAVVVCGPQGLQDDVQRSVVALSDERAVHKGTGAQGIYLHVEGFCY